MMKGLSAGLVAVALLAPLPAVVPAPAAGQETVRLTVVATTDIHGRVMHWDYLNDREAPWGLTRAATVIDSLRRTEDDELILLDAGDFLQGSPFATYFATQAVRSVHPVVDAMNALQYDAVTIGDHDFDFGLPALDTALSGALFQVVAANYYSRETQGPVYRDYALLERHGVRIGIVGVTTPGSMLWHRGTVAKTQNVRRVPAEAQRVLNALDEQAVDLKIMLMHGGLSAGSSYDTTGIGAENGAAILARLPVKPDLVVLGHSHRVGPDTIVGGVRFLRPMPWAQGLVIARITLRRDDDGVYRVARFAAEQVPLRGVHPDEAVARRLRQSDQLVRAWANAPVAVSTGGWSGQFARAEDSPLADFVGEVQRRAMGAQLSATSVYDVQTGIPAGDVLLRHFLSVYPQEYRLSSVQIDGATLKDYLEHSARFFRSFQSGESLVNPAVAGHNYDVISGVDYVVDLSMPPGSRIRQMVYRGKLVDPDDTFTLALSEHRRVGSGGYSMLSRLPVVHRHDRKIRDLLIAEATRVGTLDSSAYFTPNWQITPPHAAKAVVAEFGGARLVERTVLRVFATADFYGSLEPRVTEWSTGRQVGGAVALEAQIDSIAADCDCPTLVLDAGNHLRGSVGADRSHGKAVVEAFNTIGYDVTSIGAGDLSWGVDTLRARVAESRYRWLSANARLISRNGTPDWAEEWVMLERGGLRIAVVGVTMTNFSAMPGVADADAFGFGDGVAAVRRLLPQMSGAGADHVIVVAHADVECDESSCKGALVRLAEGLDAGSVDLIIGGHTDTEGTAVINGIPILLPGSYGLTMGVADFIARPDGRSEVRNRVETVWGDARGVPSPFGGQVVGTAVGPALPATETLATLKFAVPFDAAAESPMGRLVADAYRHAARAHIGLAMHDGIADGLSAGPVAMDRLHRVLPKQHAIARVSVTGSDLVKVLEWALESGGPRVSVSGINVWYDPEAPVGSRVQRVRFTDDRAVEPGREYVVAVSAPMTRDKSKFPSLSGAEAEDVGATDLEALADYLGRLGQPVAAPARERYHAN